MSAVSTLSSSDKTSIFWLLVLYTLQGVPLGMSAVFPLLLKERGASYSDLARFSLCSWPFALKLLWAPVVDGSSFFGVGRRKSWLVPCQLLISALLYHLSRTYEDLLSESKVDSLTLIFLGLYFLAATQDIAVDGWALTMLSEANVGYAGTCNSVGQTAGYFLAFSGFFGLSKLGLCSLETYMKIWAALFLVVTLFVAILKEEETATLEVSRPSSIVSIYTEMVSVLKLKPVITLSTVLVSMSLPFVDSLIAVKFQDAGVSPDVIALMATLTTPIHICLPWLVSKYSPKLAPLTSFRMIYPVRLMFQLVSVVLIVLTPYALQVNSSILIACFYAACLILSMVESGMMQVMFVSQMTFFARVSDPAIGGTYMTVLNTISNIGGNIAKQVSYRLAELGTTESLDGFYVVVIFATIYGIFWIGHFGKILSALQLIPEGHWRVNDSRDSPKQK